MNFLAQFDAFSTASDDYRVKTNTGAIGKLYCRANIHDLCFDI